MGACQLDETSHRASDTTCEARSQIANPTADGVFGMLSEGINFDQLAREAGKSLAGLFASQRRGRAF